jgi:hypothetical protein
MQSIPPPPFGVGIGNEHCERPWVELLSKLKVFPASISESEGRTGTTQATADAALRTRQGLHLIELRALRLPRCLPGALLMTLQSSATSGSCGTCQVSTWRDCSKRSVIITLARESTHLERAVPLREPRLASHARHPRGNERSTDDGSREQAPQRSAVCRRLRPHQPHSGEQMPLGRSRDSEFGRLVR